MYAVTELRATRVLTIVGAPGIGKSRLLREFRRGVDRLPEPIQVMHGRADQELGRLPYGLLRAMFAHYFQIQENDSPTVARERLETGMQLVLGAEGADYAPLIGQLIGLDSADEPHLRSSGDTRQLYDGGMRAITRFLSALTSEHPAIILLEDVHWADAASLDLIAHLAHEGKHIPLMIIILTRRRLFDWRPNWGQDIAGHLRIDLPPLSERDSRQLVAEILRKAGRIPTDLRSLIVARSEGNPFYIEELIKALIEDGVIIVGPTHWHVQTRALTAARIPPTLEALIRSRLESLSGNERNALAHATLVGPVFWESAVEVLLHDGLPTGIRVADLLESLARREFVVEVVPSSFAHTREYSFRNTLIFEVAKAALPISTYQRDHVRIALWLIDQSGERADTVGSLIAEHYEQAHDTALAADWWARAAQQARATYAIEAAIGFYRKALALIPSDTFYVLRYLTLLDGLGDALRQQARFSEALATLFQAQQIATTIHAPNDEIRIWAHIAEVQNSQERYRDALESVGHIEALAARCGETIELSQALTRKGWSLYYLGRTEAARTAGEQALGISTRFNALNYQAAALSLLGAIYDVMGRYVDSRRFQQQALDLYRQIGDRDGETSLLNNIGVGYATVGDWALAEQFFTDSLTLARATGVRNAEIVALDNLAGALVRLGRYAEAEAHVRESMHLAETIGRTRWAEMHYTLAEARLGQNDLDDALHHARQALELSQKADGRHDLGISWRVLGRLMALLPEHAGARACFTTSAEIFAELGNAAERARTLRYWAAYEHTHGMTEQSHALRTEAQAIFQALGLTLELQPTDASAHL